MIPFRLPPAGEGTDASLRSYLRTLVSELNGALSRMEEEREKVCSGAVSVLNPADLAVLPAGIVDAEEVCAVRMGNYLLLAAGNRLFLGTPEGDTVQWTEK